MSDGKNERRRVRVGAQGGCAASPGLSIGTIRSHHKVAEGGDYAYTAQSGRGAHLPYFPAMGPGEGARGSMLSKYM